LIQRPEQNVATSVGTLVLTLNCILSTLNFIELELELIQTHMAQEPMLRIEVCARCVARESKRKREWFGWASAVCKALAGLCGLCEVSFLHMVLLDMVVVPILLILTY
jgi:hypothetical protein